MINWIKYPDNQPEPEKYYLISDGTNVDKGCFIWNEWCPNDNSPVDGPAVTHFATINLPREETDNE